MNKEELFQKIINILTKDKFIANTISKDGRINSVKDEDDIKDILLNSELHDYIISQDIRKVADIIFDINGKKYYFNIKTTNGKSADNIFSKIGTLLAFTNIDENNLKNAISWNKFTELLFSNLKETDRDYYYLVVDKNSGRVMIRGLKELNIIKSNPSNILQMEWYKEFDRPKRENSFEDSFKYVSKKICESLNKDITGKNDFLSKFDG